MSSTLPAHRAVRSAALAGPRAWRATAVALAIAFTLGLSAPQAHALSLGRITVQSALGEALRAEIEGQWGGKAPDAAKFIDLSLYKRALGHASR